MRNEYKEKIASKIAARYADLEVRIMQDIVRRIKKTGEITSTADWQINRLKILGYSSEDIENALKDTLNASYLEMFELYDKVIDWEYVRNKDIYEQINAEYIPFEENEHLIQVTSAIKKQSLEDLENITRSLGFYLDYGGRKVLTPLSQVYSGYLDNACMDIVTGAFDYNAVLRRVVTQLTNSGLRQIEYSSGYASRIEVAARRAVMTGLTQLSGKIAEYNAEKLGTEYFEVEWHAGARPTHTVWQGRVWSQQQLYDVCGLGTVTGLCGANCYHPYFPFVPGVSVRTYTDDWLDEQNRKESEPTEFRGKEYTLYEAKQRQRQMETAMRAQREKVQLLQKGGADPQEVMLQKAKYQGQLNEYAVFSRKMGLKEERERIYIDGRGRVASTQRKNVAKDSENDIIKPRNVFERPMSNGLRTSPFYILTKEEIESIKRDAKELDIPENILRFNQGNQTGFLDKNMKINVRGDILPDKSSNIVRDILSQKAVLAHEYYGHYKNHPSQFRIGDWRDEFRASYCAAINAPNLSGEERRLLMLDAYDRAREANVSVRYNKKARRLIYGYDERTRV